MQLSKEELLTGLKYFTGSTQIFKHSVSNYSIYLTEGVNYLCENAGAYWLADIALSYQRNPKVMKENFQTWELVREKNNSFNVIATDGNGVILIKQHIPYSDFPLDKIKLYLTDKTLMLTSEY